MPRILVVDDSPTQALEMRLLLEDAGFDVETASEGGQALRCMTATPPDIVVTDLRMAGMDGLALVEAIRRDFPAVPVVLVSAYGSERAAAQALRAGAASYVPKRDLELDLIPTLRVVLDVALGRADRMTALRCLSRLETEFILENDTSLVAPVVRQLEEVLAAMRFCDPAALTQIGVALREALVNAIERGNLEVPPELRREDKQGYRDLLRRRRDESPYRDRRVYFTARLSPTEAAYEIGDEGPGFDLAAMHESSDLCHVAESGGRGLRLIRTFMDEVRQEAARNSITLVKRRAPSTACT